MRIESVTFENLNSLKGRWTVALNHPAYAATGIFAITGPTGAGKTTVLDAVSLALYGRTPRLSTLSKSENEIMTRGTGYAAAEVTFQTNGRRYRAQWEQRRARMKPDGQLQPAQVSLFEFQPATATWLSVADKVKTFTTKIQAVTGMTFEQFTRTMLLAQGNFAAFLKAETDDRAAMLERITGTEIYSRISEAAYERFAAEKEKLGQLETQLAASGTLSAQDRDATAALQKAKTEEAAVLGKTLETLKAQLALYTRAAEIETSLAKTRNDLTRARTDAERETPLKEKLIAARRTQPIADTAALVLSARQTAEKRRRETPVLTARRDAAQTALTSALTVLTQKTTCRDTAQKTFEDLIALLPKVEDLDQRTTELKGELNRRTLERQTADAKVRQAAASLFKNRSTLAADEAQKTRLTALQAENAADAKLTDELPAFTAALTRWTAAATTADAAQKKVQTARRKLTLVQKKLATLTPAADKLTQEWQHAQTALATAQKTALDVSAGTTVAALQTHATRLRRNETLFTQLGETAETLAAARERLATHRTRLESLNQDAERAQTLKTDADRALEISLATQESLSRQIEALTETARLADWRNRLTDGTPCPLCGALHHPYVEHRPDTDVTGPGAQLTAEKKKYKTLQKAAKTADEKVAAVTAELKTLTRQTTEDAAALQKATAAFTEKNAALSLTTDTDFKSLAAAAGQNAAAVEKQLQASIAAEAAVTKAREACEALSQQRQTAEIALTAARTEEASLTADNETAASDLATARDGVCAAQTAFTTLLQPFAADNTTPPTDPEAADATVRSLTDRARQYARRAEQLTQISGRLAQTAEAVKHLTAQETDLKARLGEAVTAETEARTALTAKTDERRTLFGERSPAAEKATAEKTLATAKTAFLTAQQTVQTAQQTVTAAEEACRRHAAETSDAEKALADAEPTWQAALARQGFATESDWQAARLAPDAVESLEKTLQATAERLTQLAAVETRLLSEQEKVAAALKDVPPEADLKTRAADVTAARTEADQTVGRCAERLAQDDKLLAQNRELALKIERQRSVANLWTRLKDLIGSADGKRYREFVQGLTFERLLGLANQSLVKLTDRYELTTEEKSPLTINVIDHYRGGNVRSSKNLSGGETFIVSLALALGLSRLAGRNVRVDSLFLDEGFGTLDEAALDSALSVLASLKNEGKLIGIISHVGEIRERIPARIEVTPGTGGTSTLSGPGVSAG